ncbi:hypothetical protein [Pseudomonas anguilliseptica]|uniref:hypothetical protein n=1 Tax=Pseudomonas anguilliseptica TaxID=53406 RepID=UPI00325ABEBF
MEIIQDVNQLPSQIARFKRAWQSIEEQLEHLEQFWPTLCEQYFANAVHIERAKASVWQLDGTVFGKPFTVQASPLALGDEEDPKLYAELVITMPSSKNGEALELGRMLIDREAELFSADGEKLLGNYDGRASYKLFTSIINAALRTKTA